jgi:hypothetical protein
MGSEELDELIGKALRSYSAAKPRPGLERRVLNRLAADRPPRRRFLLWAFAAALVAICIFSPFITPDRTPVRQPPRELIPRTAALAPVLNPRIPVRRRVPSPGQKDFWASTPLTDDEKAFLTLVERVPLQAEELLNSTGPQPIEPIAIEEISIPPLEENGQ